MTDRTASPISKAYAALDPSPVASRDALVERLVEALEFYADPDNWIDSPSWDGDPECFTPRCIPVISQGEDGRPCDCGDVARAALSAVERRP